MLSLPAGTGEIISTVRDNSPASQSGIRIGDIVLAVNGLPVTTERTLTGIVTLTWSRRKIGFGFMIRHSGPQLSNR
ncbi:PDZ domain-containing protein [Sphingorhabdus sp.]|uniref:PDZ domain-containing protein n=1 Tax=Sphingorhabdus sp. TaxID=1902408 RepID=UPI004053A843